MPERPTELETRLREHLAERRSAMRASGWGATGVATRARRRRARTRIAAIATVVAVVVGLALVGTSWNTASDIDPVDVPDGEPDSRADVTPSPDATTPNEPLVVAEETTVGEIVWTVLEGDRTSQPERPIDHLDGYFYGADRQGGLWRSADGVAWEIDPESAGLTGSAQLLGSGLAIDYVDDRAVLLRRTADGFEPVSLPPFAEGSRSDGLATNTRLFAASSAGTAGPTTVARSRTVSIAWYEIMGIDNPDVGDDGSESIEYELVEPAWDPTAGVVTVSSYACTGTAFDVGECADEPLGAPRMFRAEVADDTEVALVDTTTGAKVVAVAVPEGITALEWLDRLLMGGVVQSDVLEVDGDRVVVDTSAPSGVVRSVARSGDRTVLLVDPRIGPSGNVVFGVPIEIWWRDGTGDWTPSAFPEDATGFSHASLQSDGAGVILGLDLLGDKQLYRSEDAVEWERIYAGPGEVVAGAFGLVRRSNENDQYAVSTDGRDWDDVTIPAPLMENGGVLSLQVLDDVIFASIAEDTGDRTMWVGRVATD
ncbi:MAG: hypothetical protein AAF548_14725 [Actinomycetota bacterium]